MAGEESNESRPEEAHTEASESAVSPEPRSPDPSEGAAAGQLGSSDARSEAPASSRPEADQTPKLPIHWMRGGLVALGGGLLPFCTMAYEGRWRFSVAVGFVGLLVATWGLLDWVGSFDDTDSEVTARGTLRTLAPRLSELAASVISHIALLTVAVSGVLPLPVLIPALLVPATFIWVVVAVFRLGRRLGAFSDEGRTKLRHRHGFWLIVLTTVLYLPLLGSFSLSDPWETHYGEVAREMLARNDWIATWWAQDGWFWSKPVLDFWVQALAFSLLGVRYMPDEMLSTVAEGRFPQPEWAARMPIFIMTVVAVYFLYKAVAKVYGRRAGFLSGLALTTMPYWYLISHQTMTDLPYVGALTVSLSLFLLAVNTDPNEKVKSFELSVGTRVFHINVCHLVLAAVALCALPQILYLLTRNVALHLSADIFGFRLHLDEFQSGSGGGNCGLPGNQACRPEEPTNPKFQPALAAAAWAACLGLLLASKRGERRLQRLYFLGGWLFVALSALAKGAPGLVLPLACLGAFILVTGRWKQLEQMELPALFLVVLCVGLPWYVQMYMRHGHPFIDRLIMHDMYKRAFVHVHDTNQGDDVSFRYYVWQLGYGLFPWTGLGAAGLLWWLRRGDRTRDGVGDANAFFFIWFIAAFGMFTITLTKFHHYVLPLVPPIAALTGVVVDRALGAGSPARDGRLAHYLATITVGVTLVVYGIFRLYDRQLDGDPIPGDPPWTGWGILSIVLGIAVSVAAPLLFGRRRSEEQEPDTPERRYEHALLGVAGIASAIMIALAGRDMFVTNPGDIEGQIRLMHLFTYNYRRPWPDSLDFTPALIAFTIVAAPLTFLWLIGRWRRHLVVMFAAVAVVWTAWGVNVYMFELAPHWGQRETILAYYEHRESPDQPIVAYQMNWKGENFYTGNRIPAFVSSGKRFKDWIEEQKKRGVRVIYFTTEHGRIGSLKRELGNPDNFEKITDQELNNKFFLGRVEF